MPEKGTKKIETLKFQLWYSNKKFGALSIMKQTKSTKQMVLK